MTSTQSPETTTGPLALLKRFRWPILAVGGLLAAVVLALTQPWLLFVDSEVSTAFDVSISDAQAATDGPTDQQLMVEDDADEGMADDGITDDAMADDAMADEEMAEEGMADEGTADGADASADAVASGPVLLASGRFQDRSHPASGDVAFFQLEDGTRVLRFEGLETDNGPDLFVYLDTDGPDAPAGAYDDGISLGRLQGNLGDQTYVIPDDVDLDLYSTVAIWCDRFSVVFGTAELA